jgi:hypothetical protein
MTSPVSLSYQWFRTPSGGTATAIAAPRGTSSSYVVAIADEGCKLTCAVTAVNPAGNDTVTTVATAAVPTPGGSVPNVPNVAANRWQGFVNSGTEAGTAGSVAAWQALYGRNPDFIQTYLAWANGSSSIQLVTAAQLSDWGTRPLLLTVQPCGNPADVSQTSVVDWKSLIAGAYDSQIQAFGNWINTTIGRTTYIRFAHEMNVSASWYPWQLNGNSGVTSAANYAAGFNHFASVLKAASSHVQMVWCPNNNGANPVPFYPSECDIMGFDAYNKPDPWDSDTTIFTSAYNYVASCDPNKPIWVCEVGSGEPESNGSGDTKAAWVTTMLNNAGFPRIAAYCWFDKNYGSTNDNYLMNSDAASTSAYYNGYVNSRNGAVYS